MRTTQEQTHKSFLSHIYRIISPVLLCSVLWIGFAKENERERESMGCGGEHTVALTRYTLAQAEPFLPICHCFMQCMYCLLHQWMVCFCVCSVVAHIVCRFILRSTFAHIQKAAAMTVYTASMRNISIDISVMPSLVRSFSCYSARYSIGRYACGWNQWFSIVFSELGALKAANGSYFFSSKLSVHAYLRLNTVTESEYFYLTNAKWASQKYRALAESLCVWGLNLYFMRMPYAEKKAGLIAMGT